MPIRIGDPLPELEGATHWYNGSFEDIGDSIEGSPLLVHFWAVSCGVCKTNMPQIHALSAKYSDKGLRTVAVHMPLYEADTDLGRVESAIKENGIDEVCAVDNSHKLKDAFQNEQGWVPVYYLFDADGKLKMRAAGEFGAGVLKTGLERMFASRISEPAA